MLVFKFLKTMSSMFSYHFNITKKPSRSSLELFIDSFLVESGWIGVYDSALSHHVTCMRRRP